MADSTPAAPALEERLKALANVEPSLFPVISLYLDLRPNQHGRDDYGTFVRKAIPERLKVLPRPSAERDSFERDAARIQSYLGDEVEPWANGLAIFACAGDGLFEALQLEAPLDQHWLLVGSVPHLYPLARVLDMYPRYAAVLLDTNTARIFVFSLAAVERSQQVSGEKTRRHSQGGWSQARYQRHVEQYHQQHLKEVVDALDQLMRDEDLQHVIAAGTDEAVSRFRDALPAHLAEKLVATTRLGLTANDAEVMRATLDSFQRHDAETDAGRVEQLLDAWRSGGLGVAGPEATLRALELGQVDELVITGSVDTLQPVQDLPDDAAPGGVEADTSAPQGPGAEARLQLSRELVARAHQTGARVRFIEDPALLADHGGVGALLRFRL